MKNNYLISFDNVAHKFQYSLDIPIFSTGLCPKHIKMLSSDLTGRGLGSVYL